MWPALLLYVKFYFIAWPWRPDFSLDVNLETVPLSGWHFLGRAAILRLQWHWNVFISLSHYPVRCCFSRFYQSEVFMWECFPISPIFHAQWSNDPSAHPACCCVKWGNFCTENLIFLVIEKRNSSCIDTCISCYCSVSGCGEIRQPKKVSFFSCMNIHIWYIPTWCSG